MTDQIKVNVQEMDERLKPDESFDLVKRDLIIGGRPAVLYFVDGFIKDEVFEKIMEFLFKIKPEELAKIPTMESFSKDHMPYVEVDWAEDYEKAVSQILSGPAALLIDGISGVLLIDTRTYPMRGISEPDKDKSMRGSRDGFVETLIMNTAMIRRRIRDPRIRMEYYQIGSSSKVDVALSYIEGLADEKLLNQIRKQIKGIKVKGVAMTIQGISETLMPSSFFNPFPKVKFTERPDYVSACLLEGKVALVMDNSPSVMLFPVSFADFSKDADDYYFPPITGTFVRICRMLVTLLTLVAAPLFLLFTNHPELTPEWLSFLQVDETGSISIFTQLIVLEFLIEGLRLASLNTPDSLSSSLGIIGGLLLSEFAISAGWFIPQTILLMALVTISGFSQPSFEMGYAMKFERIGLLILVQLFSYWGFIAGIVLIFICMLSVKTILGHRYLYPIIPFNWKDFCRLFVRTKISKDH